MKVKSPYKLIIVYKSGRYDEVSEHKLKKKHMDKKTVDFILSPDTTRPNLYYKIKPNKLWLAHTFVSEMVLQCSLMDFEEMQIMRLNELPSRIETNSVVELIQYLTTLYRANGFSSLMDAQISEIEPVSYVFYPVYYKTTFKDETGDIICELESEKLKMTKTTLYCENGVYEYVTEGRMDAYSELMYDIDGNTKRSIQGFPLAYHLNCGYMKPVKKTSKLLDSEKLLYEISDYGAYFAITKSIFNRIIKCARFEFHVVCQWKNRQVPRPTIINPIVALEGGGAILDLLYKVYDPSAYITWMNFGPEIATYLQLVTLFYDDDAEITADDCEVSIITENSSAIHTGWAPELVTNEVFRLKDITSGRLRRAMVDRIFTKTNDE